MTGKIRVGLIGCGMISEAYFQGCKLYDNLEIVACASRDHRKAQAKAALHGIGRACSVEELLESPEVDLVLNLTPPRSHAGLNERALRAGKHVYVEKPFAMDPAEGAGVLALAESLGLRIGCAPDTFMGAGAQTCRKLIDDGAIGRPVAGLSFFMSHGPEQFHASPEFFYQPGGGPMLDLGPYYITALVNLLGPVVRVTGSSQAFFKERVIKTPARFGQSFPVDTATHITGVMDFASGASVTILTSFDLWNYPLPHLVVFGTESTLEIPTPNPIPHLPGSVGPVRLRSKDGKSYEEVPPTHPERRRGAGIADMAYAMVSGRPHRASGELANHVLEVMVAFDASSRSGSHVAIRSSCERPAALPVGLAANELDA